LGAIIEENALPKGYALGAAAASCLSSSMTCGPGIIKVTPRYCPDTKERMCGGTSSKLGRSSETCAIIFEQYSEGANILTAWKPIFSPQSLQHAGPYFLPPRRPKKKRIFRNRHAWNRPSY
jgi:hypothetical protein